MGFTAPKLYQIYTVTATDQRMSEGESEIRRFEAGTCSSLLSYSCPTAAAAVCQPCKPDVVSISKFEKEEECYTKTNNGHNLHWERKNKKVVALALAFSHPPTERGVGGWVSVAINFLWLIFEREEWTGGHLWELYYFFFLFFFFFLKVVTYTT